ncbi:MAG: hypothetical protein A2168_02315 [Planctomycetes bacterium RBG_13_50_24]|nr:MAG: hypothetical protein A2168_02315 [Planctomycetes bacterium RBG_13_50_24]
MKVTLDAQMLFDEQELEISAGSFSRDSIERTVPGLDGVLSIDLGRRSRKITQTGTLRAKSRAQLDERISRIAVFMDGDTHTLTTGSGRDFANLRMDSFKTGIENASGTGIVTDYEIVYTQLI